MTDTVHTNRLRRLRDLEWHEARGSLFIDEAAELRLIRRIESLSAPKSGESESGPARSDSRHSRQGPQPTVDGSHGKERADEGKRPTPAGKATSALDESNQQSPALRLGDSAQGHLRTDETVTGEKR